MANYKTGDILNFPYADGKINGLLLREDMLSHPDPQEPSS